MVMKTVCALCGKYSSELERCKQCEFYVCPACRSDELICNECQDDDWYEGDWYNECYDNEE